jgi:hypothetical protein
MQVRAIRCSLLVLLLYPTCWILWYNKWHRVHGAPAHVPPGEQNSTDRRQRNNDELRYALRSFFKYAPWLRHIHVLQNGDQPPPSFMWFNDWISIVDRCKLFTNASHCPTFNVHAVQNVITKIPDLAEHFMLTDDDIFLTAPSKPSHWFTTDGRPIVRTTYNQQPIYGKEYDIDRALLSQHPDWPTVKWNKFTHQIRPMRRSWIREFESKHPGFSEWVQTHQRGYYGGGVTEEMDQIWWEYMKHRVEYLDWTSPEAWCSFYSFPIADIGWDLALLGYKVLDRACGFRSINIQDAWGDEGAPQGFRVFLEELYPQKPRFERASPTPSTEANA